MRSPFWKMCLLALLVCLVAGQGNTPESFAQVKPIPIEEDEKPNPDLQTFMHAKLYHSQRVMKGLVTHDFEEIRKGAGALKQTSLDAPKPENGDKVDDELYNHFKLEFLRLTTRLGEMADEENIEGAAFVYQGLTANCMACHDYLHAQ
ncbi:MAG: hypothetical protein KDA88_02370 [Planctomycetaceae bacterium]|nr:hypothetical protein [Planctomycetaceae bacterium]MCB9952922.1 hypothetical protein [Planctomycetaceae bacterium]